jgi:23S rRNA (cytosine1962-C5)-methyltransferase
VASVALKAVEAAADRRASLRARLSQEGTDCYRFFNGAADGIEGLVIEVFGRVGFFQLHEGKLSLSDEELLVLAKWCGQNLRLESIYAKRFITDRTRSLAEVSMHSAEPFWGVASPPVITAKENGLSFLIRPYDGFSVGLFLDQRLNRKRLGEWVRPEEKVLNLFSYTCAFSVSAAARGALVTSVDLSSKCLAWGQENFKANGLEPEKHRFFSADARDFLRGAGKRGEKYSVIVLDPPSFSRSKKNAPFSVRKDLGRMLKDCGALLEPNGALFVSTNLSTWDDNELERTIESALGEVEYLPPPPLPEDYALGAAPITYRWLRRVNGLR